jgi:ABC-2 type transport system permease protein
MPLYLSRPFSRTEYVVGKLSVLVGLISMTMWIPGLLLIGLQTSLAGFSWLGEHPHVLSGVVGGSLLWIFTISILALAISAWVKWRPVAIASLFGVFFVSGGFGTATSAILETRFGVLFNLPQTMIMIWRWLFLGESTYRLMTPPWGSMPAWLGLVTLGAFWALALYMLNRKIRATQVVS